MKYESLSSRNTSFPMGKFDAGSIGGFVGSAEAVGIIVGI
jgi:hypothetical protein